MRRNLNMTNLESYITNMAKTIKKNGGADQAYHWSEIAMVLEEALKYIPKEKLMAKDYRELVFVGYTNGLQIERGSEDKGAFYSNTDNGCFVPLYMLECHSHRARITAHKIDSKKGD